MQCNALSLQKKVKGMDLQLTQYMHERVDNEVTSSSISDFEIGDKTFEVGGKNKTKKQIRNAKLGYVVKDDIEYGAENIIPLWMFGLNY